MVIDTSAIVSILFNEIDAALYARTLRAGSPRLLSVVTRVELSCVIEGRKGENGRIKLERLLGAFEHEIVGVTSQHATLAIQAFRTYGKGRHPAALNIGDCFSYALARATGFPLLFKGDDFSRTDLQSALA